MKPEKILDVIEMMLESTIEAEELQSDAHRFSSAEILQFIKENQPENLQFPARCLDGE